MRNGLGGGGRILLIFLCVCFVDFLFVFVQAFRLVLLDHPCL